MPRPRASTGPEPRRPDPGGGTTRPPPRFAVPRLHILVGDDLIASPRFEDRLRPLAEACGAELAVQLRARATPARRIYEAARQLAQAGTGAWTLVNDRLDIALSVPADGVHLREDSMPVADARALAARQVAPGRERPFLVGRSIHAVEQASRPSAELADYLVFGSVWATRSHPGRAPAGPAALASTAARAPAPVLAVGGVDPRRAAAARSLGAWGVVAHSGIWRAANPAGAAIRYLEALGGPPRPDRDPPPARLATPSGNGATQRGEAEE